MNCKICRRYLYNHENNPFLSINPVCASCRQRLDDLATQRVKEKKQIEGDTSGST